jgi:anti-sigma-K factor RskA
MRDTTLRDHLVIVSQLPDFVLGKLDETSLRRVDRHLEVCPTCRRELANAMDVLGSFTVAPPPAGWLRDAVLQRATAEQRVAVRQDIAPSIAVSQPTATGEVSQRLVSAPSRRRLLPSGESIPRWALVAASAAIFLVTALAGWSYEQRNSSAIMHLQDNPISTLMSDAATAYPLDDSDLPVSATGVLFAQPQGHQVYLVANGLPALPRNQRYQVWLFTTDDQQQSAGLVTVGANGDLRAFLETPAPFADYVGVALTAEPESGSAVPTSDLVLGGSFPPAIAALPSAPA